MSDLKPCPFCGGAADLKCTEGDYPDWFVQCADCCASADVTGPDELWGWNNRAAQPKEPTCCASMADTVDCPVHDPAPNPRGQQCELGEHCRCVEGDEPGCWNWIGEGGL